MSHGLRIWNSSGVLTFAITTQLTRRIARGEMSGFVSSSSNLNEIIYVPGLMENERWAISIHNLGFVFANVTEIGNGWFRVETQLPFGGPFDYSFNYAVLTR